MRCPKSSESKRLKLEDKKDNCSSSDTNSSRSSNKPKISSKQCLKKSLKEVTQQLFSRRRYCQGRLPKIAPTAA